MASTSSIGDRPIAWAAIPGFIDPLLHRLAVWRTRAHERRALREMDARMLSDIGVTRYDIAFEAAKPWWRA